MFETTFFFILLRKFKNSFYSFMKNETSADFWRD